jgi:hypothetical protein
MKVGKQSLRGKTRHGRIFDLTESERGKERK